MLDAVQLPPVTDDLLSIVRKLESGEADCPPADHLFHLAQRLQAVAQEAQEREWGIA